MATYARKLFIDLNMPPSWIEREKKDAKTDILSAISSQFGSNPVTVRFYERQRFDPVLQQMELNIYADMLQGEVKVMVERDTFSSVDVLGLGASNTTICSWCSSRNTNHAPTCVQCGGPLG